jgi:hypothetical protein
VGTEPNTDAREPLIAFPRKYRVAVTLAFASGLTATLAFAKKEKEKKEPKKRKRNLSPKRG